MVLSAIGDEVAPMEDTIRAARGVHARALEALEARSKVAGVCTGEVLESWFAEAISAAGRGSVARVPV